jgi:hypothetical protein
MRHPPNPRRTVRSGRTPRLLDAISIAALLVGATLPPVVMTDERVQPQTSTQTCDRRLYVAMPGIRNYLKYGGHGLLVYDIDHGHRLIRRIPTAGCDSKGVPNNVKGICACAVTKRVYTVNGRQTLCFVNVNDLLGFEVGDLITGRKRFRVEVVGFEKGPTKRHGCPSHGIGLTPDECELWLTDAHESRLHIFDATVMPPRQVASIVLKDEPGWITFSIDGQYAYPSTGDVIDVKSRKIVAELKDEAGRPVQSEKLMEIDVQSGEPVRAGDQFGIGRSTK